MIVDVHSHVLPRTLVETLEREPERFDMALEAHGHMRLLVVKGTRHGPVVPEKFDAATRLVDMDGAGVEIQVLSPTPSLFCYWSEPGWAAEIASAMNEGVAAMVAESPRFRGLGQLPLQAPDRALTEIEHLRDLGLLGVIVGGNVDTRELDDPSLEPIWARLSELELTVFVHPVNPTLLPRMEPYHLTNLIGNPLDTTIALSRLILSGVLQRYPGIRFYFAHAGGFMPYLYGRIDHAWQAREDTSADLDVLPSSFLADVWFDTITHAEPPLRYLIDAMGHRNVVVGTDYPADMSDARIARTLDLLHLDPEARVDIEHRNASRLFGLAPVEAEA